MQKYENAPQNVLRLVWYFPTNTHTPDKLGVSWVSVLGRYKDMVILGCFFQSTGVQLASSKISRF